MRNIYLTVLLSIIIGLILFVTSFFYLDTINHKTFYYRVHAEGMETGVIKIERFVTEDKIIYKSVTSLPFEPIYTEYRSRLVMDKKHNLESYTRERSTGKVVDISYLENFKNSVSYVSRYHSKFACIENIPIKKDTFIFEESSPMTYLPIIENYNFSRGRSQGFNAISCSQIWNLPPMKRFITFTSIKDEQVKVDSHKIKTENMLLKIRDCPQGAIWVTKSDRTVIKIEIPEKGLTVTRTFKPGTLKASDRVIMPNGYASKDVVFKSGAAGELAGTLTFPLNEVKSPAVLFAPGAAPQNRDYQGLFAGISDRLSKDGFVCLRFDKGSNDIADLGSALQYISTLNMVDPGKIIIVGHGKGAINAIKLAIKANVVKGLILMAPSRYSVANEGIKKEELQWMSKIAKWPEDYLNLVTRSIREAQNRVSGTQDDWTYILGKRCFLADMRNEMTEKPLDLSGISGLPVLMLQGKDSDESFVDSAASLDKLIANAGNTRHTLTYYAYLGQFFGQKINDGKHRYYYDTDREVLENIRNWIKKEPW